MAETWTYTWALRNILAQLMMPPGLWILLIVIAMIALRNRRVLQTVTISIALSLMWITSTAAFNQWLIKTSNLWMHYPEPLHVSTLDQAKVGKQRAAIVILGAGVRRGAVDNPQYQNQDVSAEAMERLRMGARLSKITTLPILVTGGSPDRTDTKNLPEGQLMAMVLAAELGVRARWIEDQSNTTQENAKFSVKILDKEQIRQVYLVTHFWHLPRAQRIFEQYGVKVIPVPIGFHDKKKLTPMDFLPRDGQTSQQLWHELIGHLWYQLKY